MDQMKSIQFAIARAGKLKSRAALAAMSTHHARSRPTPNADPERPVVWPVGSGDPAADVDARILSAGIKTRKNGVLAVELVLTASPEFFRPGDPAAVGTWEDDRLQAWAPRAVAWAQQYFGEANLVSAALHLDEATPHLHAVVVPIDDSLRKRGPRVRLNAGRWLDGRKKLAALQDSYAEAMKGLGLERGIQGRRATHQAVAKMYGRLARDTKAAAEERQKAEDMATVIGAFADGRWRVQERDGEVGIAWRDRAEKDALRPILVRVWPEVKDWAFFVSQGLKRRLRDVLAEAVGILHQAKKLPQPGPEVFGIERQVRTQFRNHGLVLKRERGKQRVR